MIRRTGSVVRILLAVVLSGILSRDPLHIAVAAESAAGRADESVSFAELQRQAASGDPEAEFNLGIAYDLGHLVKQDFAAASAWYRKAAEQGYPPAEFNLGAMYDNGRGVARDRRLAASWYRRAALHGHGRAQFDLGQMYEHGDGVARDPQQALRWYRAAARHGIAAARDKIAALAPVPPPPAPLEARRAEPPPDTAEPARQEYERGIDYWRGRGVEADSAVAFDWLSRAAAHGSEPAAYTLGYLYEYGDGTAQDLTEAYAWYRLAAATLSAGRTRDAALISGDRIAGRLTSQQLSTAEDRYRALRSQITSHATEK